MAFVDELKVHIESGNGGNGVVRFLREKFRPNGGPSGGNGGKGGDVYVRAVRDTSLLYKYRFDKAFKAENGDHGGNKSRGGKNGEDLIIDMPIGSVIANLKDDTVYELLTEGETIKILRGGRGGLGNEYFKSSTNQSPEEFTLGKSCEEAEFYIELRLVVDAGFIGYPNAGKSSLLNAITRAHAKVGAYQFTTLDPNLGDFYGYTLADIPGLIEGASEGRGLGYKFLKHISRTKVLLHCISLERENIREAYDAIRHELKDFDESLMDKKEVIILTKTDESDAQKIAQARRELADVSSRVLTVSVLDDSEIKAFGDALIAILREE